MKTFIYALAHPITKEIRYIGKSNYPKRRLQEHHCEYRHKGNTHKKNWIKSLIKEGLRAELVILEECDESNWQEREKFWISVYKERLTNSNEGGAGEFRRSRETFISDELKAKISESVRKRHREGVFIESHKKLSEKARKLIKQRASNIARGVHATDNGQWAAQIHIMGKMIYLGRYATEEDAARAYDLKVFETYGNDAIFNFPDRLHEPPPQKLGWKNKYKGVRLDKGKWTACIFINGDRLYLGRFETEQQAYEAREETKSKALSEGKRVGK